MSVNIRPYIIINGKSSNEITGLMITSLPPITKSQMRVSAEEIDGRDGDIVTELGYSAYDKPIEIALVGNYDVDEVISYFNQSGIITFSNEPDKYYKFAQYAGIDYEKLIRFKTAKVNFHVQPYKYSTESNDAVFYSPSNVTVTNAGNTNSRPSLAIQGSGDVEIAVNGSQALQIELGDAKQAIIIDTDEMNAYGTKSNVKELITDINPVLDTNGYDSVWAGGAGKNILNYLAYLRTQASGMTISATADGAIHYYGQPTVTYCQLTFTIPLSLASGTTFTVSRDKATNYQHYFALTFADDSVDYLRILPNTTSASLTLTKDLKSIDIVCLGLAVGESYNETIKFQLEKGSTATAWTPYENIGEIIGWNGCVVSRIGKNLLDGDTFADKFIGSTSYQRDTTNKTVRFSHATSSPYHQTVISGIFKPNTVYTFIFNYTAVSTNRSLRIGYTDNTNGEFYFEANDTKTVLVVTSASGKTIKDVYLSFFADGLTTIYYDESGVFEGAKTLDDFEKFVGSKYQKFFEGLMAGTYGVVDLGSLSWGYNSGTAFQAFASSSLNSVIRRNTADSIVASWVLCPIYTADSINNTIGHRNDKRISVNSSGQLWVSNFDYTDATEFKDAMSGVYLIYELATPTAPTITQPEINGLISAFGADLNAIVFGQTVFGGTLNVTTGLLTLNKKFATLNGSENWSTAGSGDNVIFSTSLAEMKSGTNLDGLANWLPPSTSFYEFGCRFGFESNYLFVYQALKLANVTDLASFKAYLASNNLNIVFPLAQPVEIQLTAEEIQTLIGTNNIWSNTGDISECIYTRAGADVTTSGAIVSFEADASDLRDDILKNRLVTGNYDNLRLKAGSNQLGISGDVDVIVLSNFSRWL